MKRKGVDTTYTDEEDAVIVHINTVFPDSLLVALNSKRKRKRVLYYGHSTMEDFQSSFRFSNMLAPLFKRWLIFCYSAGDAIITPTPYAKRILRSYGIHKPIYALSNGVDTEFFQWDQQYRNLFRRQYKLKEQDKAVMSVGHYIIRKGILEFIEMAKAMPEIQFFWFGYTDMKLIPRKVQVAIQQAPQNLHFPGYVEREELRNAYCGCDLFCFMSHEETEGIVVLEALACSIPVLVRDIPVYEDWLADGENVYKANDFKTFLKKAAEILQGTAVDLTLSGRRVAEERSLNEIGNKLLLIEEQLIRDGKEIK